MKMAGSLVSIVLFILITAEASRVKAQEVLPDSVATLFEYDRRVPLAISDSLIEDSSGTRIFHLTYASPVQGRVPAYLVMPSGDAGRPAPAILFGHWGNGTYTEFLPEAIRYARAGIVSLLVAYPWVRPAPWRRDLNNFAEPAKDRDVYAQAVVDLRRGLDLLWSRPDVDTTRIAYVGHSYGAQWGAILSAVEKRVACAVLIGGTPSFGEIFEKSEDPDMVGLRQYLGQDGLKRYLDTVSILDGIKYVPYAAPVPLLFQFARFERYFSEESMLRYYEAAMTEKQILWYNTGHEINDPQALEDRAVFLGDKLHWAKISELGR